MKRQQNILSFSFSVYWNEQPNVCVEENQFSNGKWWAVKHWWFVVDMIAHIKKKKQSGPLSCLHCTPCFGFTLTKQIPTFRHSPPIRKSKPSVTWISKIMRQMFHGSRRNLFLPLCFCVYWASSSLSELTGSWRGSGGNKGLWVSLCRSSGAISVIFPSIPSCMGWIKLVLQGEMVQM